MNRRGTSDQWLASTGVGAIAGVDNISVGIAIASLLFAGPLRPGLDMGVSIVLLSAVVLALWVALRSDLPNNVALVQETGVAILASAAATVAVRLGDDTPAAISTVLAIIGISTVLTGALLWITGKARLARLAGVLPLSVLAGFLAASGWLLIEGGLLMLTGESAVTTAVSSMRDPEIAARAVPAVVFAVVMLIVLNRWRHPIAAPALLLLGGAGFYVALGVNDISIAAARGFGWLPVVAPGVGVSLPELGMVALIEWREVLLAGPTIAAVAVLSLVGLLLNHSGLELALGRDFDANVELRETGKANMAIGLFGGTSGYTGLSMTMLADKLGVHGRGAGLATAAVLIAGFAFARPIVAHLPVFLMAGLVLYLGLELLKQWAVESRARLPRAEWAVVLLILAVVAFAGFMEGLAVGLLVSIGLFVFNYARLPIVRLSASGREMRSTVDRSPLATQLLADQGDRIEIKYLQGYLFFGTASRLVLEIKDRLDRVDLPRLRYLVIDFRHVSGSDAAAAACFVKLRNLLDAKNVQGYFSHVPTSIEASLRSAGLDFSPGSRIVLERDVDHAIERCEDALIAQAAAHVAFSSAIDNLAAVIGPHPRLADLVEAMDERHFEPGDHLIRAGDDADDVFLLVSGRVKVQITLPGGRTLRLRTMTGGSVVGEVALYLRQKRTADVIAETPAVARSLSVDLMERLERHDSELSILAHRLLACTLAEKLTLANRMIQVSQS